MNILFITKNASDVYFESTGTIVRVPFPEDAVKDMEVVNQEILISTFIGFIDQNKIPLSSISIILSDVICFQKDIQITTDKKDQEKVSEIQHFVDNIPFESVATVQVPIEEGIKIIAVNKTLYSAIQLAFEQKGFSIHCVIPALLLGIQQDTLDASLVKLIQEKVDSVRQYSMVIKKEEPLAIQPENKNKIENSKKVSSRTVLLLCIFIVLLAALGILLFLQQ